MTVVTIAVLDVEAARRLTERIRYTALGVRDGMEKLQVLVQQAKDGGAHEALGYASWTAYLADTLGAEPLRLPRDQRQELVGYLAGEGMSTRAIAPIVGADHATVVRDRQVVHNAPPEPPVNIETGEVSDDYPARVVTGLDGKTYKPTRPSAPRATPRRPLPDQFFDAIYDLTKSMERVSRLCDDDRFAQNAKKVGAKHRADLLRARDLLQQVIDRLT